MASAGDPEKKVCRGKAAWTPRGVNAPAAKLVETTAPAMLARTNVLRVMLMMASRWT
jgi:hypothetical protein